MRQRKALGLAAGLLLLAGPASAQLWNQQPWNQESPWEAERPMSKEEARDELREMQRERRGGYRGERRAYRQDAEDAREFLREAQEAIEEGRFGRANEYLERAATRMLSRSTEPSRAREPVRDRSLAHISEAREALTRRDPRRAMRQIERAIESIEG